MGDRNHKSGLHPNSELLLRRPVIGHNGGPLDMSWEAWIWRRAAAKAWKTPKPEVALRRMARAEKLGITYREFTAVILDTGTYLSTALVPLGLVARIRHTAERTIAVEARPEMAAKLARFGGRLLLVADPLIHGKLPPEALGDLRLSLSAALPCAVEAIGLRDDVKGLMRVAAVPKQEAFFVGTGFADVAVAEAAGLSLFKWAHEWLP
ncbi:MAG: hypothetical protein KF889_20445 [Alphaproteobacteria bacterium]|nr:hypothetical protein [Alphaproteobacteria bacterium]MCW5744226.1 hypothetical protein [Alphaproteobacteria bacterium]